MSLCWTCFKIDVSKNWAAGWWPTQNLSHPPVSRHGPQFSHSAWHAWWISRLQPDTRHETRLGPLKAQLNTHAPTESQSQLDWTEVLPETFTFFFDAVGISDVPETSGIDVNPPNVLFASAELGNVVATASGNVAAMAFDYDLVRRMDDENAYFCAWWCTWKCSRASMLRSHLSLCLCSLRLCQMIWWKSCAVAWRTHLSLRQHGLHQFNGSWVH